MFSRRDAANKEPGAQKVSNKPQIIFWVHTGKQSFASAFCGGKLIFTADTANNFWHICISRPECIEDEVPHNFLFCNKNMFIVLFYRNLGHKHFKSNVSLTELTEVAIIFTCPCWWWCFPKTKQIPAQNLLPCLSKIIQCSQNIFLFFVKYDVICFLRFFWNCIFRLSAVDNCDNFQKCRLLRFSNERDFVLNFRICHQTQEKEIFLTHFQNKHTLNKNNC